MLIWWTDSAAIEAIGSELPAEAPEYLRAEYRSRHGRVGHGRLWVASRFPPDVQVYSWPQTPLAVWLQRCAGIVIADEDVLHVADLPGTVTDLDINRARVLLVHLT